MYLPSLQHHPARAIENSTSEASTAKKIRKALKRVGQFDAIYISSFENLAHMIEEPILELRGLAEFVASIVKEGDEILPHHSPPKTPTLSKSSLSKPSSHLAETKDASTVPTSSPYLTTSLNREPATMASYSGHVKTKSTASQRGGGSSGFEDLLEAAGYDPGTSKKSPSPENESKRESTIDPQYQGSPSYSPPPSPSVSIDILLKPYSVSSIKAEEPSPDISSSILLEPSTLNGFNPSPAPPGTPQWKIDLSERKGHRIQDLHVSPRELDILTRCLTLIHKATLKGEECMRVIVARKNLATEMEREYKQWEDVRLELEANVRIDKEAAQEKMEEDFDDTEADDGDEGQAEDRGRPRDFGMGSQSSTVHMGSPMSGSHCSSNTEGVDVVTHFEEAFEEGEGGDGTDQEMLDAGAGADEGLEQGEITEGPLAGVDEEKEAEDEEMKSGNDDEHPKTRANGKKGLKSGGKVLGLYGEDV